MPLKWLCNFGRFKSSLIEIVSLNVTLTTSHKGTLILGRKCGIESGSCIKSSGGHIKIGNGVYINRYCNIVSKESVVIGDGSCLGPNVSVYDHDHSFGGNKKKGYKTAPICIGRNVWIGTGAIILKGVTVGDESVIGAGAIITKDIPSNTIVTLKNEIILREIE